MTNLETTLGMIKDVSSDALGSLHHGLETLSETVSETVSDRFGHAPPPAHKGRWLGLAVLVVGAVVAFLILRSRRSAPVQSEAERAIA